MCYLEGIYLFSERGVSIVDAAERAIKRVTQPTADQGLSPDASMARKAGI